MAKKSKLLNGVLLTVFITSLVFCGLGATGKATSLPGLNSLYPSFSPITFMVIDNQGNLIPNVDLLWFNGETDPSYQYMLSNPQTYPNPVPPPNQWLYAGSTDQYGYWHMIGYSGQQYKATYNGVTGYGSTSGSSECVIVIPIFVGATAQPTPTPTPAPTATPQPTYQTTIEAKGLPDGLKWGIIVDGKPAVYSQTTSITVSVTNGLHDYTIVNPVGYVADSATQQLATWGNGGVYPWQFSQIAPSQTQQVSLMVDDSTPDNGQTVYFTVSTNPHQVNVECKLHAYINGQEVAFNGVEGAFTAANGMALLSAAPNSPVMTWKVTIAGATSNSVTTTINSPNPSGNPTPTVNPTPTPPPEVDINSEIALASGVLAALTAIALAFYNLRK